MLRAGLRIWIVFPRHYKEKGLPFFDQAHTPDLHIYSIGPLSLIRWSKRAIPDARPKWLRKIQSYRWYRAARRFWRSSKATVVEAVKQHPLFHRVTVYEVDRWYGGHEEGGWWWDKWRPIRSYRVFPWQDGGDLIAKLEAEYEKDQPEHDRFSMANEGPEYHVERERYYGENETFNEGYC